MKLLTSLLALAALALTGCSSYVAPDYQPTAQSDEGVVVFTVTQEHSRAENRREKIDFLFSGGALGYRKIVASARSGWDFSVEPAFGKAYGRVYVLRFPVGMNQLTHWSMNDGFNNFYPPAPLPPLTFEVKPGSVTYLGNLHGKLLWGKNLFGGNVVTGVNTEVSDQSERDLKLVLQRYPQFAGRITVAPLRPGPWLPE
ncbi:MAG: hypothetical protein PHH47_06985 [Gallionella sp.]|nr:hypothetical protein [Gallionella sp.]MDD4946672.1 hypothetical protein [Gallionella sp.]